VDGVDGCVLVNIEPSSSSCQFCIVQGKAGKYTEYSTSTGITKTVGQSTACATTNRVVVVRQDDGNDDANEDEDDSADWSATFLEYAVPAISHRAQCFATDRDWLPYHTPRNILLALLGELGELAELLQFKGDAGNVTLSSATELNKISQELADVTIYLLRLSDVTGTDIGSVALALRGVP
jgi:dCTP diphosphatase